MILAIYIYLGPVMDAFTSFHNNATQGAMAYLPISQDRQDAIFITQLSWRDYPLVAFLILLIAGVVVTLRRRNQVA
jgi:hypothetical protein